MFTVRLPREIAIALAQHLSDQPNISRFGWAKTNSLKFSHQAVSVLLLRCHRELNLRPKNASLWKNAFNAICRAVGISPDSIRVDVTEDDIRAYLSEAESERNELRAVMARAALNGNTFKRDFVTSFIFHSRLVSLGVTV